MNELTNLQEGNGVSAMATILARIAMPHVFITGGARQDFPTGATVPLKPFGREDLLAARIALQDMAAAKNRGH